MVQHPQNRLQTMKLQAMKLYKPIRDGSHETEAKGRETGRGKNQTIQQRTEDINTMF